MDATELSSDLYKSSRVHMYPHTHHAHTGIYTINYIENNTSEEAIGELLVLHAGKLGTQGAGAGKSLKLA